MPTICRTNSANPLRYKDFNQLLQGRYVRADFHASSQLDRSRVKSGVRSGQGQGLLRSGRETLLRALNQQSVDRMRVSPFVYASFVQEFFPDRDLDPIKPTNETCSHFGFDLRHRNCSGV